jgi:hypothetical protein
MQLRQKLARPAGVLLAALVFILTVAVVGHALQAVTIPNTTLLSYNLAPGGFMVMTVPAIDQPVLLMGTTTTVGVRGIGQVSLMRVSAAPAYLEWVGLHSPNPVSFASGFSAAAGTLIAYLDVTHLVRLEVHNATQVRVRNTAAAVRAGNVKMIW